MGPMTNVILNRINRTGEALKRNNMAFYYAETKDDVPSLVESLLNTGDIVAAGGSVTLKQCGVLDLLKTDKYKYLDSEAVDADDKKKIYHAAFSANAYLMSTNAITESGELYNVDGRSNRIAALAYGPESVIIVAGYNKIVKDIEHAQHRVKFCAAPANTMRLNSATYCYQMGECSALAEGKTGITDGCDSFDRICCNYMISAVQKEKDRIKVILVNDILGY